MDLQEIKSQLNRIEDKLDSHVERIVKVEVEMHGVKGFIKTGLGLIIAAISGLVSMFFGSHFKG